MTIETLLENIHKELQQSNELLKGIHDVQLHVKGNFQDIVEDSKKHIIDDIKEEVEKAEDKPKKKTTKKKKVEKKVEVVETEPVEADLEALVVEVTAFAKELAQQGVCKISDVKARIAKLGYASIADVPYDKLYQLKISLEELQFKFEQGEIPQD